MKDNTTLTKKELIKIVSKYQNALFRIKNLCDNPEQFKDEDNAKNFLECCLYVVGTVGGIATFALGLDD